MNLDQIKVENIREILNQVRLSLESDLQDRNIRIEDGVYQFEIYPDVKDSYDSFKFDVSVKKNKSSFFGLDTSTYEFTFIIKKKNYSSSWYEQDSFKLTDKQYSVEVSQIFNIVSNEFNRRDIENKNKKINQYIDLIKTTVKPEVKRDVSIDEILN